MTLYEPNLKPDELFEVIALAFLNAVDQDAILGWGVRSLICVCSLRFESSLTSIVRRIKSLSDT